MTTLPQHHSTPYKQRMPFTRCGSSPRLICYTQSNSKRMFNYQRPPNELQQQLTGRTLRHITPTPSKDIAQFRIVNITKLPNSKRTIIPELAVSTLCNVVYIYIYNSHNPK